MPSEAHDPETGEFIPNVADGSKPVPAATNFGQILAMCEEGRLDYQLSEDLRKLVHQLRAVAITNGGKARGKVTVTLDVAVEGDHAMVVGDYAVKLPKAKRPPSIAFMTDDGRLTPNRPNQHQFFGPRSVSPASNAIVDVTATSAPLKAI